VNEREGGKKRNSQRQSSLLFFTRSSGRWRQAICLASSLSPSLKPAQPRLQCSVPSAQRAHLAASSVDAPPRRGEEEEKSIRP